jgi:hypothetical protein
MAAGSDNVSQPTRRGNAAGMSLRGSPVVRNARLPGGDEVEVRIGVPDDGYLAPQLLETVVLELTRAGTHLGALTTLLRPEQEGEALALAHEVVRRLESGEVEPTHPGRFERLPWMA